MLRWSDHIITIAESKDVRWDLFAPWQRDTDGEIHLTTFGTSKSKEDQLTQISLGFYGDVVDTRVIATGRFFGLGNTGYEFSETTTKFLWVERANQVGKVWVRNAIAEENSIEAPLGHKTQVTTFSATYFLDDYRFVQNFGQNYGFAHETVKTDGTSEITFQAFDIATDRKLSNATTVAHLPNSSAYWTLDSWNAERYFTLVEGRTAKNQVAVDLDTFLLNGQPGEEGRDYRVTIPRVADLYFAELTIDPFNLPKSDFALAALVRPGGRALKGEAISISAINDIGPRSVGVLKQVTITPGDHSSAVIADYSLFVAEGKLLVTYVQRGTLFARLIDLKTMEREPPMVIAAPGWFEEAGGILNYGDGRALISYSENGLKGVIVDTKTMAMRKEGGDGTDRFAGTAFADEFAGLAGNDEAEGGAGADRLDGGSGVDTLRFVRSQQGVVVDLGEDLASGGDAEGDVITGFESLIGSSFADNLIGTAGANTMDAGAGDDTVSGLAGRDVLIGGPGSDTLIYAGSNAVTVDLSRNFVSGGNARGDVIKGFENIVGSDKADKLIGNSDANIIAGGLGGDTIDGGKGFDSASYSAEGAVSINLEKGIFELAAQGDLLTQIEGFIGSMTGADLLIGSSKKNAFAGLGGNDVLEGLADADTLDGGGGSDLLHGGTGTDRLIGGSGNDRLTGGIGLDKLTGGQGSDTFVFDSFWGSDTISDFTDGRDKLAFHKSVADSFADFTFQQHHPTSLKIYLREFDGSSIGLSGTGPIKLTAADFTFFD